MNAILVARGRGRARWLAVSAASALIVSFGAAGMAAAQVATPDPVRQAPFTPTPADQLANATGAIKMIDVAKREITLDNDQVYRVATNIDLAAMKQGDRVTVSYNLEGANRTIVKVESPLPR